MSFRGAITDIEESLIKSDELLLKHVSCRNGPKGRQRMMWGTSRAPPTEVFSISLGAGLGVWRESTCLLMGVLAPSQTPLTISHTHLEPRSLAACRTWGLSPVNRLCLHVFSDGL